ncbi:MAG: hypothetical protein HC848_00085 [Limnobacter sp.]|nr:hypothetical protein [Limnobacter sp.]
MFLIGPQASNLYSFFYDGAGNPIRIPVSYNGFIPRSPSEGSTLTTIFGESAQARQREVRSAVRTESVADRLVNGVIAELGKGKPATEGGGGLKKPDSCESSEQGGC